MKTIAFSMPRLAAVAAVATLAACAGGSHGYAPYSGDSPSVAAPRAAAAFPGKSDVGVAAHYVVFQRNLPNGSATIDVISVQEAASYKEAFGSLVARLAGASIEYPDGSVQSVNAHGEFDAGASSYARAHPEGLTGKDVTVRVHPPKGSSLKTGVATIYAPSEAEEKKIVSGVIPPDATPSGVTANGVVWSCDPKDYEAKTLLVVKPNRLEGYSFAVKDETVWYEQQFFTCGTDRASNRIAWSAARWEHISAGFGTNAHTRWSLSYIPDRFYGTEVALLASPSDFNSHDLPLALIGQ